MTSSGCLSRALKGRGPRLSCLVCIGCLPKGIMSNFGVWHARNMCTGCHEAVGSAWGWLGLQVGTRGSVICVARALLAGFRVSRYSFRVFAETGVKLRRSGDVGEVLAEDAG